jgi:drug/metabolite transporter (DMT)-like permease
MPGALDPPQLGVVVLGLVSALAWGLSDFGGGMSVRRAPLLGVLIVTQLIGVAIAIPAALALGEARLAPADVGWSILSGGLGIIGLGSLYQGLAVGRMGVVAPVTGVLVAAIPVSAGIVLEGLPSGLVLVGAGLAIASVAVVSRVPGDSAQRTSGFWWGIAAGLALGGVTLGLSRIGDGLVFGPLALVRTIEAAAALLLVIVGRRRWQVPRSLWPVMLAVGALDMVGTAAYIAATQAGPLAVAGVLSALYPVVTVILAIAVLHERVSRAHALGIVVAAVAVALIAGGSAG